MIISHKYRFVFIHIYKTAGDSIASALSPFLGPDDIRTDDYRRQRGLGALGPPALNKHTSAETCISLIGRELWQQYSTFAVVRHPMDRAQSLFQYAKQRNEAWANVPWHRALRQRLGLIDAPSSWALQRAVAAGDNFSAFIRRPSLQNHPALKPQTEMLSDATGRILVKKVMHFESLKAEFSDTIAALGLPALSLPHLNRSTRSNTRPPSLQDQTFIAQRYRQDFETFGYSVERP